MSSDLTSLVSVTIHERKEGQGSFTPLDVSKKGDGFPSVVAHRGSLIRVRVEFNSDNGSAILVVPSHNERCFYPGIVITGSGQKRVVFPGPGGRPCRLSSDTRKADFIGLALLLGKAIPRYGLSDEELDSNGEVLSMPDGQRVIFTPTSEDPTVLMYRVDLVTPHVIRPTNGVQAECSRVPRRPRVLSSAPFPDRIGISR